ncbi:MAG: DNA primase [Clostridia bacterium]
MSFSKTFIDEIKDRSNIEDIIGAYLPLKRAGGNLVGLCPFHNEKTPSFTVYPGTSSYYCFGCGSGGDVFTFVMQHEGLDYPSAVERLAKIAGIPMEENTSPDYHVPLVKKDRIIQITKDAGRFFYSCLMENDIGASARQYITNRRLTDITVKRFGIGYAPDSWDMLYHHLVSKGYSLIEMKTAFLVGESKKGNPFDIFRNRIMFPIFDLNGDCVAFSGRRINDADERKYVNTSDTPAFKKSRVIFGMNIAKQNNDGNIILCEGAIDAIALQQAGFSNAVATLGTAITGDHARIIANVAKTVFVAYDIDKAGRKATDKAIGLLNSVGISVKIINLGNETKDPDEFIKKYGSDAFRRCLDTSNGQIDYTIDEIIKKYSITAPDEKLRAANELYAYISTVANKTEREIYAARVADKLDLQRQTARDEIEKRASFYVKKQISKYTKSDLQQTEGYGDKANREKVKFSAFATLEERALGILLIRPDTARECANVLSANDFITEFNKKLFELFYDDFVEGHEIVLSKDNILTHDEISAASRMMAQRLNLNENGTEAFKKIAEKLKMEKEKRDYDKKIEQNPNELSDYINIMRIKITEDKNEK